MGWGLLCCSQPARGQCDGTSGILDLRGDTGRRYRVARSVRDPRGVAWRDERLEQDGIPNARDDGRNGDLLRYVRDRAGRSHPRVQPCLPNYQVDWRRLPYLSWPYRLAQPLGWALSRSDR